MPLANIHTMNIFEQIIQFFKDKRTEQARPREIMLKELLSYARRGQYNEQFSDALRIVDEAALLAGEIGNPVHIADVMLHRVDILIAQGDHEEAARVLDELEKFCAGVGFKAPLAYTYIARGVLAKHRRNMNWHAITLSRRTRLPPKPVPPAHRGASPVIWRI